MAYTLLDAAYAIYYPEAEFGIKDTLGRLKSRAKKAGNRLKTRVGRKAWKMSGSDRVMKDPGMRAVMRTNTKRNKLTKKRAASAATGQTYLSGLMASASKSTRR